MTSHKPYLQSGCSTALLLISALGLGACSNSNDSSNEKDPSIKLANFQDASVVIGQTDFRGYEINQGGTTTPGANTLHSPYGNPTVNNGILYLSDFFNNRVLGFNTLPVVNNANADFVLGQVDFSSDLPGASATDFSGPLQTVIDNGKMFMGTFPNNRVLIWNTIPTSGNVPADIVLGQADLTSNAITCSASGFSGATSVAAAGGKLVVTDYDQHRVMIWNTIPQVNNQPADIVLGQQSFTQCAANDSNDDGVTDYQVDEVTEVVTASTLWRPNGVWTDGVRLVVLDSDNHRVLIWNNFPTENFTPADVVLGQSDFSHNTANDDNQNGISAIDDVDELVTSRVLNTPFLGVYSNGVQLFITDSYNNRLLIWNSFPTVSFTPADQVLGQSDFSHITENDDDQLNDIDATASARTLSFPTGVMQYAGKLIVNDSRNNRTLIFQGEIVKTRP